MGGAPVLPNLTLPRRQRWGSTHSLATLVQQIPPFAQSMPSQLPLVGLASEREA
jgi:hypothetical protein